MRIDHLKSGNIDRSTTSTVEYQMVRGTLSDLLIINTTTHHWKDKLTVKLRSEAGLKTIVDRVSMLLLASLCDCKKGMPTTGTPDYVGTPDGNNEDNQGFVRVNAGVQFYENAFVLPLGHISLSGMQQLEIIVETAAQTAVTADGKQPKGRVHISAVQRKTRLDTLLTYDVSGDLEATQNNIREIYLVGKDQVSFFTSTPGAAYGLPQAKDITVKLGVDGDDSENSLEAYAAMTAIEGQFTYMPNNLIRIFQDFDSLPASTYIKVFGDDADDAQILYIREDVVPHMVGQSILSGLEKETKRVEVLAANEPEKAAALIQTGKIAAPEALKAAADAIAPTVSTPLK